MNDLEIKEKIKEVDKQISNLKTQKNKLQLELTKQNTNYIGRYFEMRNMDYVYVKSYDEFFKTNICIAFSVFEGSVNINYYCFDINDVEKELTKEEFLAGIKKEIDWDFIKKLLEGEV